MRKCICALAACLILITCVGESWADSDDEIGVATFGKPFGNLTTAKAVGQGVGNVMGAIGIGDNASSLYGAAKFGMSQYTTMRGKLGIADPDMKGVGARFCIGGDFSYQLFDMTKDTDKPVDFAFGGFSEYVDFDGASLIHVGGRSIASRPYLMSNNRALTPYGSVELRIERVSWKGGSDSNLRFGLNAGVAYELGDYMNVYGEFQLDGNEGVFFGLEYNIM